MSTLAEASILYTCRTTGANATVLSDAWIAFIRNRVEPRARVLYAVVGEQRFLFSVLLFLDVLYLVKAQSETKCEYAKNQFNFIQGLLTGAMNCNGFTMYVIAVIESLIGLYPFLEEHVGLAYAPGHVVGALFKDGHAVAFVETTASPDSGFPMWMTNADDKRAYDAMIMHLVKRRLIQSREYGMWVLPRSSPRDMVPEYVTPFRLALKFNRVWIENADTAADVWVDEIAKDMRVAH